MAAHQAPLSLGFSRQEHWNGLPFPSPRHESEKWKWSCSVMSDPQRPHGLQPTRLLHPWDFPEKSTGVGCHCLLRVSLLPLHKCWQKTGDSQRLFRDKRLCYSWFYRLHQLTFPLVLMLPSLHRTTWVGIDECCTITVFVSHWGTPTLGNPKL